MSLLQKLASMFCLLACFDKAYSFYIPLSPHRVNILDNQLGFMCGLLKWPVMTTNKVQNVSSNIISRTNPCTLTELSELADLLVIIFIFYFHAFSTMILLSTCRTFTKSPFVNPISVAYFLGRTIENDDSPIRP